MKQCKTIGAFLLLGLILAACNMPADIPEVLATETATVIVASPAVAPPVPTATEPVSKYIPASGENLAFDFVVSACDAEWMNNAYHLPCPGHLEDATQGYVEYTDHTVAEGMTSVEAPMLIALPGQGNGNGIGLFGRYPLMLIQSGDTFKATIACQGDSLCDTEFALEYFDAAGNYHDADWSWHHQVGYGLEEISADLSSLAGQNISLMLVARDKNGTSGNWLVWIQPRVTRDPNVQPVPTLTPAVENPPTPTQEITSSALGQIGGRVDSSSAPPYLNDPVVGPSPRIVVVAFDVETGAYWHAPVSPTAHLYYQLTVPVGTYHVVAYAIGVGDVPYVAGAYTGAVPSCGQELMTVEVFEGAMSGDEIVVADWNWTCSGTAFRPEKPNDVPIP